MTTAEPQPFACSHSPNLPELLYRLNCTLAVSTYQAGKVILISAKDPNKLVQLPRSFQKPMGLAHDGSRLAIATQTEVVILRNAPAMAANYPQHPNTYDALFMPRASYYTGEIDIHDLYWSNETLWAVNTRFSCLSTIDQSYSFTPQWKPFFIDRITPDDQCHLNGVAMENDVPKFVTALGRSNVGGGWRDTKASGGIIMDVKENSIVCTNLQMPHSPRIYDGNLFVLESASGELTSVEVLSGKKTSVCTLDGFVRGMDRMGDFLFIGISKLRKKSAAFADLPIAEKTIFSGVAVVHLPTRKKIGFLKYENSVEEIYDVRVLPGMRRPNILNHTRLENRLALTTPDDGYWAQMKESEKK
jgi:uncharacterized protein (TIGR03032 family)